MTGASDALAAGRRSFWQAVAVEVEAFGRGQHRGHVSRARLALRNTLATFFYERRVHPSGEAVCLLGPRLVLVVVAGVSVLAGGMALGVLAPLGSLAALCAVAALAASASSAPSALPRAAKRAAAKWRWRRLGPKGKRVYLRSLASTRKGAGAELLAAVIEEADSRGWTLVLDAAGPGLVGYYKQFGFACLAQGQPGEGARMWRPPRGGQGPDPGLGAP